MAMTSDFTRFKFEWLDQVAADRKVSALAFKLAYRLASTFLNRHSGTAWPTQQTLAAALGVTPRAIRKLSRELAPYLAVRV
jgi:hypothetical protein